MGFKPIFEDRIFLIIFEPFFLLYKQTTKSAQGQQKERSNQKAENNKTAFKLNFLSKSKWTGFNFEVEHLTVPGHVAWTLGKSLVLRKVEIFFTCKALVDAVSLVSFGAK